MAYDIPIHVENSPRYQIPVFGSIYKLADAIGIPIYFIEAVRDPYYFKLSLDGEPIEIETIPKLNAFLRGA